MIRSNDPSDLLPEGETLRKAVRWISQQREAGWKGSLFPLVEEASRRFDLSPKDAEFLIRFLKKADAGDQEGSH